MSHLSCQRMVIFRGFSWCQSPPPPPEWWAPVQYTRRHSHNANMFANAVVQPKKKEDQTEIALLCATMTWFVIIILYKFELWILLLGFPEGGFLLGNVQFFFKLSVKSVVWKALGLPIPRGYIHVFCVCSMKMLLGTLLAERFL